MNEICSVVCADGNSFAVYHFSYKYNILFVFVFTNTNNMIDCFKGFV